MGNRQRTQAAALLGSLGGKARARSLTAEQRREIARLGGKKKAANAKRGAGTKARRGAQRKAGK